MSQPPEEIRFDNTHIVVPNPYQRIAETSASKGSSQHQQDRRRQPPTDDAAADDIEPHDVIDVSSDYVAVNSAPPDTSATVSAALMDGRMPVPSSAPDLHLDIKV